MHREWQSVRRVLVGASALALSACAATSAGVPETLPAQQPTTAQPQSNFMGGNPSQAELGDTRTMRLRFPAGSRSNWHTHTAGQLLMLEEGRGLTQVRGQPLYEMRPFEPWFTAAGVEHWHGAHPDEASLQLTIYGGTVNWLGPVTDDVYRARAQRP